MTIFLILPFLLGNFIQKWYFPQGIDWGASRIAIGDTDRDGHLEFIFTTYGDWPIARIYFYELHLPDTWEVDSVPYLNAPILWDIGDFDVDGLCDLTMQCGSTNPFWVGITVFESPDSFSYPTQEVWRDTVGSPLVTPICVYDIDEDSLPEIVKVLGDYIHLHIYESIGNNLYDKIEEITTSSTHNSSSTLAFGDFDSDNKNEFVWGYSAGEYSIWECTGNNSYQEILLQQLPTVNIKDCFSVADADGDGKMEFVVKGFVIPSAEIHAFIFEAISDNTYEIIKTFTLPGGDYYGGYSEAGDVDGDSIPEIVLEARQNVFIIKAEGNDSFYVWDTLPGHAGGSCVRIFDIDENGLSEIIISGADETRIYEYDPGGMEETALRLLPNALRLEVYPNPFRDKVSIVLRAESKEVTTLGPMPFAPYIKIYDVTGRLVKSFSRSTPDALCSTLITWHGDDENGRAVSDGVYFIRLEDRYSGTVDVRKVLKVR